MPQGHPSLRCSKPLRLSQSAAQLNRMRRAALGEAAFYCSFAIIFQFLSQRQQAGGGSPACILLIREIALATDVIMWLILKYLTQNPLAATFFSFFMFLLSRGEDSGWEDFHFD